MNDALSVRVLHRVADLRDEVEAASQIEGLLMGEGSERGPRDVLHREERKRTAPQLFDDGDVGLDDAGDADMLKPSQQTRFTKKAWDRSPGIVEIPEHLDRDLALGARLPREVDGAHAAATELAEHTVGSDSNRNRRRPDRSETG